MTSPLSSRTILDSGILNVLSVLSITFREASSYHSRKVGRILIHTINPVKSISRIKKTEVLNKNLNKNLNISNMQAKNITTQYVKPLYFSRSFFTCLRYFLIFLIITPLNFIPEIIKLKRQIKKSITYE